MKLYCGTNVQNGKRLVNREFKEYLIWLSNDLETLEHYYEGSAVMVDINLKTEDMQDYVRERKEINDIKSYTYGMIETEVPKGALWFSFNERYLSKILNSISEIEL